MALVRTKPRKIERLDTREKIVQSSIALFNQKGIQNIALRHIASDVGISLGNLTYHFSRKQDLIHATLEALRDRLTIALAPPVNVDSLQYSVDYLIRVYATLWEFRFYFNALNYLLTHDRQLRDEYYEFRDWLLEKMELVLSDLNKKGAWRKADPPNTMRLQAENIWRLWLCWLRMYQLDNLSTKVSMDDALYDCALHHWSLVQGWLTPDYSQELIKAFQDKLLREPKSRAQAKKPAKRG